MHLTCIPVHDLAGHKALIVSNFAGANAWLHAQPALIFIASHHTRCMTPAGPLQDVKTVRWHPLGEVLVSASYDDTIKLWVEEDDEWVCAQTLAGEGAAEGGALAWGSCAGASHAGTCHTVHHANPTCSR